MAILYSFMISMCFGIPFIIYIIINSVVICEYLSKYFSLRLERNKRILEIKRNYIKDKKEIKK